MLQARQRQPRTAPRAPESLDATPLLIGAGRRAVELGGVQAIPVNVFATTEGVEIVAPLPGLEPEDIQVDVVGTTVTIHGSMRGVGQERKQYYVREWRYGPYLRSVELPFPVNAAEARATFGNGVLTLTLPHALNARPALTSRPRTIHLRATAFSGRFGSSQQDEGEPGIAEAG